MLKIVQAETEDYLQHITELFKEYAASLDFDLSFQDFKQEVQHLPGEYAPPDGRLLLAVYNEQIAGCVALRKMTEDICEMKRLFVRPEFRGQGIGKALALVIIEEAHSVGYSKMRLDTVPSMKEANALYKSLGFKNIKPYRYNPIEGATFMELNLEF
ncbi:MAG: GNAT family N-acetyltransferase [bacterium]